MNQFAMSTNPIDMAVARAQGRSSTGRSFRTTPYSPYLPNIERLRQLPPNMFDLILMGQTRLWELIQSHGGVHEVRFRSHNTHLYPQLKQVFKQSGSILLPADDGLDHLIFSFKVPTGYRLTVSSLTHEYTGTGFEEGSGDITWRIQSNTHYLATLGAMLMTMGSIQGVTETIPPETINFDSGKLIQYWVNIAPGASARLAGGRIVAMVTGTLHPRDY